MNPLSRLDQLNKPDHLDHSNKMPFRKYLAK